MFTFMCQRPDFSSGDEVWGEEEENELKMKEDRE